MPLGQVFRPQLVSWGRARTVEAERRRQSGAKARRRRDTIVVVLGLWIKDGGVCLGMEGRGRGATTRF